MTNSKHDIVLITGAGGGIGSALTRRLKRDYTVVGLDLDASDEPDHILGCDLTNRDSVELALRKFRDRYGNRIASVVHLAAYFDFTGEENPLYDAVNVEGTRVLLRALQDFEVDQFVYSGTMLVHRATSPGQPIDEEAPIEPKWAYPESKARTEEVIREEHGDIPYVLLHLAGLYDDETVVPTLAQQIKRIYEREFKSHLYPADTDVGQAYVHRADVIDAIYRTVERRRGLGAGRTILIGEAETASYQHLQDRIGYLIHGEETWPTIDVPKPLAVTGAKLEAATEPVVPDAIDRGEKPFVRPFMVEMADDHYELDVSRAEELLGWMPRHSIDDSLENIIGALMKDPAGWYDSHGIARPPWLDTAMQETDDPEGLRRSHEMHYRALHRRNLWGGFVNFGLGTWLMTAGPTLGYTSQALSWSDFLCGIATVALALASLSWRLRAARWVLAGIGLWLLFAPLVFWAPTAAAYLNDTLIGGLMIGLAAGLRPTPGIDRVAAMAGPVVPKGWSYSPSGWFQRIPIIVLAFVGLYISRYLAAYQLGHIDGVWEPFFSGRPGGGNGTEEIVTSSVSEAWPVSDAGIGAVTYMLEIVTGLIGSSRRWRTMPWLVVLFGILIVPLGIVSVTFIVIQPIVIGTWCTLCLIAAAAMLLQIPYSIDELLATGQFLYRRKRAGKSLLRVFLFGDTDEDGSDERESFDQSPLDLLWEMLAGGITLPWNLIVVLAIGIWLMFTRVTIGANDGMANADHLIGSLVITFTVAALAEMARPLRYLNVVFGLALLATPFLYGATTGGMAASFVCGAALILLSIPRGRIANSYGRWSRILV